MSYVTWLYPAELNDQDNFEFRQFTLDSGEKVKISCLSEFDDILEQEGVYVHRDIFISDYLITHKHLADNPLVIVCPIHKVPHNFFYNKKMFDAWLQIFTKCLFVMQCFPSSRIVVGSCWDEWNISNFYNVDSLEVNDLISCILDCMREHNISVSRLTWIYSNTLVPTWIKERLLPNEPSPHTVYWSIYLKLVKELHGTNKPSISSKNIKVKHFLCFNRRPVPYRLALCFWFWKTLNKPSNISCRITSDPYEIAPKIDHSHAGKIGLDAIQPYFPNTQITLNEYESFYSTLPWAVDQPSSSGFSVVSGHMHYLDKTFIEESACTVVTETQFDDLYNNYQGWFSEKTMRSFLWGLPTIWLSPHNMLSSISHLGFKVNHNLINYEYDSEADPAKRFYLVTKELDRIQKIPNIQEWYSQNTETAEHNLETLNCLMSLKISNSILSCFSTRF